MTDEEIIAKIRLRGYSTDITNNEIAEAISAAIGHVIEHNPYERFGTFETVAAQQVYDLFGSGGAFQGGVEVLEIFGASCGESDAANPFGIAPYLQGLSFNPGAGEWFTNPSDMLIFEANMSAYAGRFATVGFEPSSSAAGASIRIVPVPLEARTLGVRYTFPRTEAEIRATNDEWLLTLVEAMCCRVLARKYALVGGIRTGLHADSGFTAKFYREEHDRLMKEADAKSPFLTNLAAVARS